MSHVRSVVPCGACTTSLCHFPADVRSRVSFGRTRTVGTARPASPRGRAVSAIKIRVGVISSKHPPARREGVCDGATATERDRARAEREL